MQVSGLTVAWHGTRSLKDWVAYVEDGDEHGHLVLAHQVSERTVKGLLARIQNLSRDELHAMGRPVEAVAQQGGGPPIRRPPVNGQATPGSEIAVPPTGRQLALTGDGVGESGLPERSRRRRRAPGPGRYRAAAPLPAGDPRGGAGAATRRTGGAPGGGGGLRRAAQHLRDRLVSRQPGTDRPGDRGGGHGAVADGSLRGRDARAASTRPHRRAGGHSDPARALRGVTARRSADQRARTRGLWGSSESSPSPRRA